MEDRLEEALCLIINKVSPETKKVLQNVLELNDVINNGYTDWNDWMDFYEDKSEDGLRAYLKELFIQEV